MNVRAFSIIMTLALPLTALACSSGDSARTGDDQNVTSGHPATCGGKTCGDSLRCCNNACQPAGLACHAPAPGEEGATCGGFAGLTCKSGLTCKGADAHSDASGTCHKSPAVEGEVCFSFVGGSRDCAAGLTCKVLGDSGTCRKSALPGEEGGECAGFAGISCKHGLSCQIDPKDANTADAGGTCVK